MSGFMNKMLNMVGFGTDEEYEEDYGYEEEMNEQNDVVDRMSDRRSSRVVRLHNSPNQMRVVVIQPESFDEARDITNHLKDRRPIVVNMETLDKQIARRIVDFLSGAVYALDGDIQKISNGIFIIVPSNVDILNSELTSDTVTYSFGN